jgi:hypothetical protein
MSRKGKYPDIASRAEQ